MLIHQTGLRFENVFPRAERTSALVLYDFRCRAKREGTKREFVLQRSNRDPVEYAPECHFCDALKANGNVPGVYLG